MSNEKLIVKTSQCLCLPHAAVIPGLSVTWRAVYNPAFMPLDVIAWTLQGRRRLSHQPQAALRAIRM